MGRAMILVLPLLLSSLSSGALPGQSPDLSGAWIGDAVLPGSTETDHITLVLEKAGDSYSGRFSDSRELARDAALRDVTYNNGNLRFKVPVVIDGRNQTLRFGLNFHSGRLIGGWGTEGGNYGTLELSRRPK